MLTREEMELEALLLEVKQARLQAQVEKEEYIDQLKTFSPPEFLKEAKRLNKLLKLDNYYDPDSFDVYDMLEQLLDHADQAGCYESVMAIFDKSGFQFD
jgi:hypothetical protein